MVFTAPSIMWAHTHLHTHTVGNHMISLSKEFGHTLYDHLDDSLFLNMEHQLVPGGEVVKLAPLAHNAHQADQAVECSGLGYQVFQQSEEVNMAKRLLHH